MIRKLIKPWNALPAGAAVTLDPAEQVALVDPERLVHLEKEGHLERLAFTPREIPSEVRTTGGTVDEIPRQLDRPLAEVRQEGSEAIARGGPIRRRQPLDEPPPLPDDAATKEP